MTEKVEDGKEEWGGELKRIGGEEPCKLLNGESEGLVGGWRSHDWDEPLPLVPVGRVVNRVQNWKTG